MLYINTVQKRGIQLYVDLLSQKLKKFWNGLLFIAYNNFYDKTGTSKTIGKPLTAKLMSNAIELGTYEIGEVCQENFKALFERIFSYFNEAQ